MQYTNMVYYITYWDAVFSKIALTTCNYIIIMIKCVYIKDLVNFVILHCRLHHGEEHNHLT